MHATYTTYAEALDGMVIELQHAELGKGGLLVR